MVCLSLPRPLSLSQATSPDSPRKSSMHMLRGLTCATGKHHQGVWLTGTKCMVQPGPAIDLPPLPPPSSSVHRMGSTRVPFCLSVNMLGGMACEHCLPTGGQALAPGLAQPLTLACMPFAPPPPTFSAEVSHPSSKPAVAQTESEVISSLVHQFRRPPPVPQQPEPQPLRSGPPMPSSPLHQMLQVRHPSPCHPSGSAGEERPHSALWWVGCEAYGQWMGRSHGRPLLASPPTAPLPLQVVDLPPLPADVTDERLCRLRQQATDILHRVQTLLAAQPTPKAEACSSPGSSCSGALPGGASHSGGPLRGLESHALMDEATQAPPSSIPLASLQKLAEGIGKLFPP